jgi:predicted dehydrogenase
VKQSFDFIVLGGGGRGTLFSKWVAEHPEAGRVVAVAELRPDRRRAIAELHGIKPEFQFERWEEALARPKFADAVLDGLMDRLHAPSALAALNKGYNLLLEKPMATTLEDCVAIDQARRKNNAIVAVCHTMRYHRAYAEIKRIIDSGQIGKVVCFGQVEGVGAIHQSHSFVRGNWGNEERSTFMLMSKSCHDVDMLSYILGKPCRRVSSFGNLSHFNRANASAGAPERCTDGCPHEVNCMYAAQKIYLPDDLGWAPHANIRGTRVERLEQLKTSPYGRCVYKCDNDVVDHQVVNFEYEDGITGTFTMTAFLKGNRHLRLHGTEGSLNLDIESNTIEIYRYRDEATQVLKIPVQPGSHAGGDHNILTAFVHALRQNDPNAVLTGTAESLESHRIVFAAEKSRREGRTVELAELR